MTSRWVARVIATYRSTAPSMPSPNDSGSTSTTGSNSSPLDRSGVSERTRGVGRKVPSSISLPMTQAIPSSWAATQVSMMDASPAVAPCSTGTPLLRTEVGTSASGNTVLITGSASAITSSGVR